MNLNAWVKAEIPEAPILPFLVTGVVRQIRANGTVEGGREGPYTLVVFARHDGPASSLSNDDVVQEKVPFAGSEGYKESWPPFAPIAEMRVSPLRGSVKRGRRSTRRVWEATKVERIGKQLYEAKPELYDQAWDAAVRYATEGHTLEETESRVVHVLSQLEGRTREEARQVAEAVMNDLERQWNLTARPRGGPRRTTGGDGGTSGRSRDASIRPSYVAPPIESSRSGEGYGVVSPYINGDTTGVSPAMHEWSSRELDRGMVGVATSIVLEVMEDLPDPTRLRGVMPEVMERMQEEYPDIDYDLLYDVAKRAVGEVTAPQVKPPVHRPMKPGPVPSEDELSRIGPGPKDRPEQGNYHRPWERRSWYRRLMEDMRA